MSETGQTRPLRFPGRVLVDRHQGELAIVAAVADPVPATESDSRSDAAATHHPVIRRCVDALNPPATRILAVAHHGQRFRAWRLINAGFEPVCRRVER